MKIMVAYNGGKEGEALLKLAKEYALKFDAFVVIVNSMKGGTSEDEEDIRRADKLLALAGKMMEDAGLQCETQQSVRGLFPGEDLVLFAEENQIDHIFMGIRKKSRVEKIILGSTARYVILKAPCPVTTTK